MSWESLVGAIVSPVQAMKLALEEGKRGWGFVAPNPLVGCTIVDRDHRLLSVGYHAFVGGDHAEISALKKLGDTSKVEGAHVYVTLEPCAHQGRTGSCAKALAPLKPASVTYAVEDPNPLVAGKGASLLREVGVRCDHLRDRSDISTIERASLEAAAEELAEVFLHNQRFNEPFIGLKVAMSSDGMIASKTGEPRWLTGEKSREHVHWLRAGYDAVLVGRGTFETDDPALNIRHPAFPNYENHAIVVDPSGRSFSTLLSSNLLQSHEAENILVVVGDSAEMQSHFAKEAEAIGALDLLGVQIIKLPLDSSGEFAMKQMLGALYKAGIRSIMVEGGARTYGTFVRAGVVHRLHVYKAPMTIGPDAGLSWSGNFDEADLMKKVDNQTIQRERFSPDEYWTARLR